MKAGTVIQLPDGRLGTVVYNSLDGKGIMFGRVDVDVDVINNANSLFGEAPQDYPYTPDAMLRDPKLAHLWPGLECVGEDFEIVAPAKAVQP